MTVDMKIFVSACLLGENCKYNGGNNLNQNLVEWLDKNDCQVIPVCPEVLGGLPTPRIPSEIVNGVVTNAQGVVVDDQFRKGAQIVLDKAKKEKPDMCILQSRSPSCGVKQIYDGTFSKKLICGKGITAKVLYEAGFQIIDIEDFKLKK